jgi:hypothetical protein
MARRPSGMPKAAHTARTSKLVCVTNRHRRSPNSVSIIRRCAGSAGRSTMAWSAVAICTSRTPKSGPKNRGPDSSIGVVSTSSPNSVSEAANRANTSGSGSATIRTGRPHTSRM